MSVAKRINRHMRDNGIKLTYLSEKTGISEEQIILSLTGKRKLAIEEYLIICEALGVDIKTFIDISVIA